MRIWPERVLMHRRLRLAILSLIAEALCLSTSLAAKTSAQAGVSVRGHVGDVLLGRRIRVMCCNSNDWQLGRLESISDSTLVLGITGDAKTVYRTSFPIVERSTGKSKSQIVYGAVLGALAGFLIGDAIGAHIYGRQDLSGALGVPVSQLIGLGAGATIGVVVGYTVAPEEWEPVNDVWKRLPGK